MTEIDREQMLRLAGIEYRDGYTPVTIGKKNKVTRPKNLWADQFRNLNFHNLEELRAITPEDVTARQCFYQKEDGSYGIIDNKRAIVGNTTANVYAVHSDKYQPIQHSVIVEAMADACKDTDISVFGHFDEDRGRFNGYGTFANPDFHIGLGLENAMEDPVMLGMRFFNSHNGDSTFGGEIYGIRAICQNYMAWGETLGKVKIMHFKSEENIAEELADILKGFRDRIGTLQDRIHIIQDTPVDITEQELLLWGIGMNPDHIENILTHRHHLNPEMPIASTGSVWDIYNASTAFVTYHVGGNHTIKRNLSISENIEKMLLKAPSVLIRDGEERRTKYLEEAGKERKLIQVKAVA